ncbi:MAG: hypothetical protein H7263_07330 [Candidatus Sericytochromatia bacterium]|nr:hypothetical protein [Candidatus Sericytochromatia bacterium]
MSQDQNLNKVEKDKIICYNCNRTIDVKDISEASFFKCRQCYVTLIKSDFFRVSKNGIAKRRNKMITLGLVLGLFPMPVILAYVSTKPVEIVIFYFILNILMIFSINYFSKKAADILFGIIFAEVGIFANITRLIFINFSLPKYADKIPELRFQIYFFLAMSVFMTAMGISRRRKFVLK